MKNFRKTIIDEFAKSTQRKKFAKIARNRIEKNQKTKKRCKREIKKRLDFRKQISKKRDEKFDNAANSKNRSKKIAISEKFEIDDLIRTKRTKRTKTGAKIFYLSKILINEREDFFRKVQKILKIVKAETLKRLTIIVTDSTKSYFVVLKTTEFIELNDKLNKVTKLRILSQVNKTFANLFK